MLLRRVLYRVMFPAVVVLPLWTLVGGSLIAGVSASDFVAYLFIAPMLFASMGVITALIAFRASTRAAKAVSWIDVALLCAVYLAVILAGLVASTAVVALVVVVLIGAFWVAVWQIVRETRMRVRAFVDSLENTPRQQSYIPPTRHATIIVEPDEGSR